MQAAKACIQAKACPVSCAHVAAAASNQEPKEFIAFSIFAIFQRHSCLLAQDRAWLHAINSEHLTAYESQVQHQSASKWHAVLTILMTHLACYLHVDHHAWMAIMLMLVPA